MMETYWFINKLEIMKFPKRFQSVTELWVNLFKSNCETNAAIFNKLIEFTNL